MQTIIKFDMYLSDRVALPLNYNPALLMNNEEREEYGEQLVRAGNLIISSLRFWRSLRENLLSPEVFHLDPKKSDTKFFRNLVRLMPPFATYLAYTMKAYPLDMSQYSQLFGTTRIPQLHKDVLSLNPNSRHIIIMRKGNIYKMNVLKESGEIESPNIIYARLLAIVDSDERRPPSSVPLGVLTTCERNSWAKTRQELLKNEHNKQLLEEHLDKALFCLSLDTDCEPSEYNDETAIPIYKNMLAGNSRNRWFDKSISLLVSKNGVAAVNFEHSWGDGVAVLRYFNEIYKDTKEQPILSKNLEAATKIDIETDENIRFLDFRDLQGDIENAVKIAEREHDEKMDNLNLHLLRYPSMNRQLCKKGDLSADAMMQLSFQLAYYKAWRSFVGSYESCSTSAFRHGRTETLRPCTNAVKDFCLQAVRGGEGEMFGMLKKCSEKHMQLTREAAMGQGFDRHLFALRTMLEKEQVAELPSLFKGTAYKRINYNIISTSTLNSPALLLGGFGPVVSDGLGIGYSIRSDECGAIVSSYKGKRDGELFVKHLQESLEQIQQIINKNLK